MKGVPYEVANELPSTDRLAWTIIMGELEGGTFNWRRMEWEKPREVGE